MAEGVNIRSTAQDGQDYGAIVDSSGSLRVLSVPPVVLGSYSVGTRSAIMAAGISADTEIYQFLYTGATLAVIRSIHISAGNDGTAFAAGSCLFQAIVARAWTVAGTGGGTATITGDNMKLRTSFASTAVGEIRTATTAALGAGTKTLDATGIGSFAGGVPAVAGQTIVPFTQLFDGTSYPLVLANNEGFVITQTVPATGTWKFSVNVKWDGVTAY